MNALLFRGGQLAGLVGVLLMIVGVAARLAGLYSFRGFASGTLMLAGIGAVSVGCFLMLWLLVERARR
jgi:hypothetical protein